MAEHTATIGSKSKSSTTAPPVDPALLAFGQPTPSASGAEADLAIDPALFAIEQVVEDVRRGKVKLYDEGSGGNEDQVQIDADLPGPGDASGHPDGLGMMDDEFDPALREIVNSLTNAQQSTGLMGTNLTAAQAQAAIDAHLHEDHGHGHGLELKTLEDLERAGYGIMEDQYQNDPNFLLPDQSAGPSSSPHSGPGPTGTSSPQASLDPEGNRRPLHPGRGRPKGSRNKPKPGRVTPPPPPPKEAKPRGRPRKKRTPEEEAEMERKRLDKAQGIKRAKGRPRKFPGFLVREMRLKRNRSEYRELMRTFEEGEPGPSDHSHAHSHGHGHEHGYNSDMGMDMDMDIGIDGQVDGPRGDGEGNHEFWSENMERSILAAVEGLEGGDHHGTGDHAHQGPSMLAEAEEVPSSRAFEGDGGGEMEMRRVFGLPAEGEGDGA